MNSALANRTIAETKIRPRWYDTMADQLAAWVQTVVGEGSRDPHQLAGRLGVRVEHDALEEPLEGLTVSRNHVLVSTRLDEARQRFVLAHELAHVLAERGEGHARVWGCEERWADAFARELLAPLEEVRDVVGATGDLSEAWRRTLEYSAGRLPAIEAWVQVQALGHVPELAWGPDGTVACAQCGTRRPVAGCCCLAYRQRPAMRAERPELALGGTGGSR